MNLRLLYESHSHTPLCQHAVGLPQEYAEAAERRGLRGLIVTCHNPMPNGFSPRVRMRADQWETYLDIVDRARRSWAGRVDVRLGLEADYFPGYETWVERQLRTADFQYVLGSVHPQLTEFRSRFEDGNPRNLQRTYFGLLADAAETGLFDCLAHPDLIKNETPTAWDPQLIMDDICRAMDRIAATGVAMELNTSGADKTIAEMNPFPEMLRQMHSRAIPVVLGGDAHHPRRVGDRFGQALRLLQQCGYTTVSHYLHRQRFETCISAALTSLAAPSEASTAAS